MHKMAPGSAAGRRARSGLSSRIGHRIHRAQVVMASDAEERSLPIGKHDEFIKLRFTPCP
jgi:hypothetical protein